METSHLRAASKPSALIFLFPELLGSSSCSRSIAGSRGLGASNLIWVGKEGKNSRLKHPRRKFSQAATASQPREGGIPAEQLPGWADTSGKHSQGDSGWQILILTCLAGFSGGVLALNTPSAIKPQLWAGWGVRISQSTQILWRREGNCGSLLWNASLRL